VDRAMGSVHMGVGICLLDVGGVIQPHVHSFEESFYILDGSVSLEVGNVSSALGPGDFGLIGTGIRHSWKNVGDRRVRWLEVPAPQPRPIEYGQDSFFSRPGVAAEPLYGHFDETQLPKPGGASQMEGFNPTTGVAIKMFVDRSFGAVHQSLFLI